jgi:hypothetical protein
VLQHVKSSSDENATVGATALKASFLCGALTNTSFTEDTNLSINGKFARIISATSSTHKGKAR